MTLPASTTAEDLPLGELHEWGRNPRRISKPRLEALKRALVAEPEMLLARPLIALPDGTVVAGNQRLRAARELGWPSLPVVVVDLDEARAAEWALRDNRPYGEDDEALVGALLAELAADGRALDLTGYDSESVDELLAQTRAPDWDAALGILGAERLPYQTMTFALHDSQVETITAALKSAAEDAPDGQNPNAYALARICEIYLSGDG